MSAVFGIVSLLATANVFAAPAMSYKCVGLNKTTQQAVVFDVDFSEYDPSFGYANQSISVSYNGGDLKKAVIMQMTSGKKKNECKKNSEGEINILASGFESGEESDADRSSKVAFKTKCAGGFDVVGTCVRSF
jgi:hypothetical protein